MRTRYAPWRLPNPALVVAALAVVALAGCGTDGATDAASDPGSDSSVSEPSEPSGTPSASVATPSESTTPTASKTPTKSKAPSGPACTDVWVDGAQMPGKYEGCVADGELVAPDALACSSGQRIVRYDDRFWTVLGGKIHETPQKLLRNPVYRDSLRSCRG